MKKINFLVDATDSFALRVFRALLLALGLVAVTQGTAFAQSTWTVTATATNSWDSNGNWSPNTGFPNGAGVTANVTANITTNEVINLDQAITLGTLNIGDSTTTDHTYTIAANGGSLTMDNNGNGSGALIAQSSSSDGDTISAPIIMADSNATSALTISNASTTHALTISGGITSTQTSGSNLVLSSTGAGGLLLSTGNINNSGTITNSGSSGTATISSIIGSNVTGVVQNSTTSALSLSGANTFTGPLTIDAGSVVGSGSSATPISLFGLGTILLGNTSGSSNATLNANTTGSSGLVFTNAITVEAGTSGTLTIESGANTLHSESFSGPIALNNNLTVDGLASGLGLVLSGTITENSSALTITKGTGAGNATLSGGVVVGSGGLTFASSASGGTYSITGGVTGTGNLTFNDSTIGITASTLALNNAGTITNSGAGAGTTTISGGVGSNVTGITESSATSALTISGALTVNGSGTTLTNSSNAKILTVSGGVAGTGNLVLDNNGTLANGITISTTGININGSITNSGTGSGVTLISATVGGTGALPTSITQNGTSPLTVSGAIGGSVSSVTLASTTTGGLILSGANTGFGGELLLNSTAVTPVVTQLNNVSALNLNNVVVFGASSTTDLELGNSITIGGLSSNATAGTPTVDLIGNAALSTLTLNVSGGSSYTFGGVIEDFPTAYISNNPLALTKSGAGTQILSGTNTYSGGTMVNQGTLESTLTVSGGTPFGAYDSSEGSSNDTVTLNGGVLNLTPALVTSGTQISLASATTSGAQFKVLGGSTLALNKNGNESLTYTVGNTGAVLNVSANGSLVILPASGLANLGSATAGERFIISGTAPATANGMVLPSIVGQDTDGTGDFLNYNATNGFVEASTEVNESGSTTLTTTTEISNINGATTLSGTNTIYAMRVGAFTVGLAASSTLTPGSGGIILNGGTINGTGTITLGSVQGEFYTGTANGTISAPITGTGGLTSFGPGTLSLSGTNSSLSGLININGILTAATDSALGTGNLVFNGGTLNMGVAGFAFGASKTITVNLGGGTLNTETGGTTLASTNNILGAGPLTIAGTGGINVKSTNSSYTGTTTILGGTLELSSGTIGTGTVILGNTSGSVNTEIELNGSGFGNAIIAQGGNSGTVTLTAVNNSNQTFSSSITLGTNGPTAGTGVAHGITLRVESFESVKYSGTISDAINITPGTGGLVTITDAGSFLAITGNNTYTGGTLLNSGTVSFSSNTAFGTGTITINGGNISTAGSSFSGTFGNVTLTNNNAEVWDSDFAYSGGGTTGNNGNAGTNLNLGTGAINLGALNTGGTTGDASRVVTVTNILTVGGVISNGTNGLTNGLTFGAGTGTLVLGGVNTYTGGTVISLGYAAGVTGTIQLSGSGTLGATTGPLTVNSGFVDLNGTNQTVGTFSGLGGTVTNTNATTASTLTVSNSTPVVFAGSLTNLTKSLGLTKNGNSTLTLTGASTNTGVMTINAGILNVSSNASTTPTATTLGLTTGATFASGLTAHTLFTIANSTGVAVGQLFTGTGVPANTTIFSVSGSQISLTAATTAASSGTYLAYTNLPNTATGNSGTTTLTISGGATTGIAVGDLVTGTGIVANTFVTSVTGSGVGATIGISQATTANASGDYVFGGVNQVSVASSAGLADGETVTGTGISGSIVRIGGNVLSLSANNTAISTPTATLGAWDSTGNTVAIPGAITFGGGTLQYSATSVQAADYSGRIANSSGAITIDTNGQNVTYASSLVVSNVGGLTLNDTNGSPGSLTLSAMNAYLGTTKVTSGTLKLSGAGTLGSTNNDLTVNGGVLDLNGTSQTVANFGGTGGTVRDGNASPSTLTIGNNNGTGGNYAGVISSGTGVLSVTKVGTGKITLSGTNTYTGGTTITGGTLYVNNNPSLGSGTGTGSVLVQIGGTLAGSGKVGGAVTVQSGGTLASGAAQTNVVSPTNLGGIDTVTGTGLTADLEVDGGAKLQFDLGAGANTNVTAGVPNFASPNMNSTYLTATGPVTFGTTGGAVNINLVDLTAFSSTDTLQLRYQNPYLLITAGSTLSADLEYNLVTSGGYDGNGYVLGIYTGGSTTQGALGDTYEANSFNLSATDINGGALVNPYSDLQLYLYNGDLEVIPEPGTWALMLGGLALLVFIQQRRKSKLS